ncbi:hypothetical protein BGX34_003768 [Mortierella sp. NVP85]|nr:hypothetical protein BGX34_003768 [Mortierella sp. NVP85]
MIFWGKLALWKINKQDGDKKQARNENGGSVLYIDLHCELVAFSPNGLQIAYNRSIERGNGGDYAVYLYDTATGTQIWASNGHTGEITSIVYSSHGDMIVTTSNDQTVRLWDALSGQCRAVIQDFQHWINGIAWVETSNAQYVFAGCRDGTVGMWQVIMDEERCQVRLHWKTTNGMFNAEGAIIQGIQGLSPLNERILMTRVAEEDEESDKSEEGNKSEENEENREVVNQEVSPPPFTPFRVFLKRIFELDEEDEDVAKRMRSN